MRILADKVIASKPRRTNSVRNFAHEISRDVRKARKFVLEEHATSLMTELANMTPLEAKRAIQVGWPAEDNLWFEFPTKVVLDTRERLRPGWKASLKEEFGFDIEKEISDRTGFLITKEQISRRDGGSEKVVFDLGEEFFNLLIIEQCERFQLEDEVFVWPLGYAVAKVPKPDPDFLTLKKAREYAGRAWGMNDQLVDMDPLLGHVRMTTHRDLMDRQFHELLNVAMRELAGTIRLAITAMTLLNTVATPTAPVVSRPRFIQGGRTHPALPYYPLTVSVPKKHYERPAGYIKNQIAAHHRRLHEVRGHWRHVARQPRTEGWEEIQMGGVTYWRKAIQAHMRGDPSLGVVEHEKRFVR